MEVLEKVFDKLALSSKQEQFKSNKSDVEDIKSDKVYKVAGFCRHCPHSPERRVGAKAKCQKSSFDEGNGAEEQREGIEHTLCSLRVGLLAATSCDVVLKKRMSLKAANLWLQIFGLGRA